MEKDDAVFSLEVSCKKEGFAVSVWYNEVINKYLLNSGTNINVAILDILVNFIFQLGDDQYLDIDTILNQKLTERRMSRAIEASRKRET